MVFLLLDWCATRFVLPGLPSRLALEEEVSHPIDWDRLLPPFSYDLLLMDEHHLQDLLKSVLCLGGSNNSDQHTVLFWKARHDRQHS